MSTLKVLCVHGGGVSPVCAGPVESACVLSGLWIRPWGFQLLKTGGLLIHFSFQKHLNACGIQILLKKKELRVDPVQHFPAVQDEVPEQM